MVSPIDRMMEEDVVHIGRNTQSLKRMKIKPLQQPDATRVTVILEK